MAGDWIKVEMTTPDKPEISGIADQLNIDIDTAFGKVFRVWAWFDQHSTDGHAPSVTKKTLDRVAGVPGFCDAMATVEWFVDDGEFITMPNFERHNGESAKKRALASDRKRKSRNKSDSVTDGSRSERDKNDPKSVTREEKRRVTTTTSTAGGEQYADGTEFSMHADWQPNSKFEDRLTMSGIPSHVFTIENVGEFKSFWMTEPGTRLTQSKWEHKLIQALRRASHVQQQSPDGNPNGPAGGNRAAVVAALRDVENTKWAN